VEQSGFGGFLLQQSIRTPFRLFSFDFLFRYSRKAANKALESLEWLLSVSIFGVLHAMLSQVSRVDI
jgi:hypothetical protein